MIRIRSKKPGFRRGGMAHSTEWTEYPDGRFTGKELARIQAEPMLQVEIVEETVAASGPMTGDPSPKTDSVSETESVSSPPARKTSKAAKA